MPRIGAVLKDFEATTEHKVVCVEGAERAAIRSLPYWMCGVDMMDLYSEKRIRELDTQVRREDWAVVRRSGCIVSAIHKFACAGRNLLTSPRDKIITARHPE